MFLFLALAAAVTAAPQTDRSIPKPISGSIAGLISSDDYPAQALDRGEEGAVGILIKVDASGAVSDCIVQSSSGSAALDAQTCRLIWLRAKFLPARDRAGRPVAGEYPVRIKWRIAEDWVPTEPWSTRIIVNFGPDGRPLACRVEMDGAMARSPGEKPQSCPPEFTQRDAPVVAELPGAIASMVIEERFLLDRSQEPVLNKGDVLMARQLFELEINASGKVTSCRLAEHSGLQPPTDSCAEFLSKTYRPRKGKDGQSMPFSAITTRSIYVHAEKLANLGSSGPRGT